MVPEAEAEAFARGDEAVMGLDVARDAGFYPPDYRLAACRWDEMAVLASGEKEMAFIWSFLTLPATALGESAITEL